MRAVHGLVIGFAITASLLASSACAQSAYPEWFLHPPVGDSVAVFAANDTAALDIGATLLATYSRAVVWGDFQRLYVPTIDADSKNNTDYYYYFDPSEAKDWKARSGILAGSLVSYLPEERLYLVGPEMILSAFSKMITSISPDTPPPSWVDEVGFIKDGTVFGVGRFTLQGRTSDAWIKAEELAIFNLLTTQSLTIGALTQIERRNSAEEETKIEWVRLRYQILKLQVVERWIDLENDLCMVLASAPQSSIRRLK